MGHFHRAFLISCSHVHETLQTAFHSIERVNVSKSMIYKTGCFLQPQVCPKGAGISTAFRTPMDEREYDSLKTFNELRPLQKVWVIAITLVIFLPPTIVQIFDLPPASWLISEESKFFVGRYLPKLTWLVLVAGNMLVVFVLLFLIQIPVKLLTGKKLFQLFSKKSTN
jgi:hypothetical protein